MQDTEQEYQKQIKELEQQVRPLQQLDFERKAVPTPVGD